MKKRVVIRRLLAIGVSTMVAAVILLTHAPTTQFTTYNNDLPVDGSAAEALDRLAVKGRAPKTGYERSQFGDGWAVTYGCDTRQIILYRDLTEVVMADDCRVASGVLRDPYTARTISYDKDDASRIQIDHVVALSDAWQKGAQLLTYEQRRQLANDPLELLAVEGAANQQKGDADAASWLPDNTAERSPGLVGASWISARRRHGGDRAHR